MTFEKKCLFPKTEPEKAMNEEFRWLSVVGGRVLSCLGPSRKNRKGQVEHQTRSL